MKKIAKLSFDCAAGREIRDKEFEMMNQYNDYFINRAYDALLIDQHVKGYSLFFTLMYISHRCNWRNTISGLNPQKLYNLAHHTQLSYRAVKYHNQCHASDVMNHLYDMIFNCDVFKICQMEPMDVFLTIISGAAHDMDHPGTNNAFEMKSHSKLAILYNDISILEQHHAASFFFLLENTQHNCNVL